MDSGHEKELFSLFVNQEKIIWDNPRNKKKYVFSSKSEKKIEKIVISKMAGENLLTRKRQTFSGFVLGVLTTLTVIVSIFSKLKAWIFIWEKILNFYHAAY